jgi:hypothetical protein
LQEPHALLVSPIDHLVIVLNKPSDVGELDLLVDAPDRGDFTCITGPESDGDVVCNANYIANQQVEGLEVITIKNPVAGKYSVAVRSNEGVDDSEFTLTAYSPYLGKLELTDSTGTASPDDPNISTEDPAFADVDGPGLVFTFTLPGPQ